RGEARHIERVRVRTGHALQPRPLRVRRGGGLAAELAEAVGRVGHARHLGLRPAKESAAPAATGHPPASPVLDCAPAEGDGPRGDEAISDDSDELDSLFSAETFRRPVSGASMISPTKLGFALSALVIASGVVALPPASSAQE